MREYIGILVVLGAVIVILIGVNAARNATA